MTLHTLFVWPVSGRPIGWPVSAFHTRAVPSAVPETIRFPSGLNATLITDPVMMGAPIGFPVSASDLARVVPTAGKETIRFRPG